MVSERELQAALRRVEPPDADAAAARAWVAVETALDAPAPRRRRGFRRRGRTLRATVAALVLVPLGAAAAAPPSLDAVGDWLRSALEPPRAAPQTIATFPGGGEVLVRSGSGWWITDDRGRRTRLGRWDAASWSPHARFIAAVRGRELAAVDRRGRVRWRLERPYPLAQPAWSPGAGQRVAYRSLDGLRVVAGDGTGDRLVAGPLGPAGPAWRPWDGRELAWADRAGRVHVVDADTGVERWRSRPGPPARRLVWASSGQRLAIVTDHELRVLDVAGRTLTRIRARSPHRILAAAFTRGGRHPLAYAVRKGGRITVRMTSGRRRVGKIAGGRWSTPLFTARGRTAGLVASPDGDWILVDLPDTDQWLLLGAPYVNGVAAVREVSRRFGSDPRVQGWCCPP